MSSVLLGVYVFCFFIQLWYYYVFLKVCGIKNHEIDKTSISWPPVSVIICAKNEADNLNQYLTEILLQDYEDFEVIVVNDGSVDGTKDVLSKLKLNHFNLKTVDLEATPNSGGKKNAFEKGVFCAANDCLVLTDADCFPTSDKWLQNLSLGFVFNKGITLGYSPYVKHRTILNKLIQFDTYFIAKQYLSFAILGFPYMGIGRNMGYKRSLFLENDGFNSHKDLLSGDDDLFVNEVITSNNHHLSIENDSWVYSVPKESYGDWLLQKRRHLTTGPRYKFMHKALLVSFPVTMFAFYITFLLLLGNTSKSLLVLVTGIFIFKIFTQLVSYQKVMRRLNVGELWLLSPLLEIAVFGINGILFFTNTFIKPRKWN